MRRVQARSHRPGGGPWWLGPLFGLLLGTMCLAAFGLAVSARPFASNGGPAPTARVITITPSPVPPTDTPAPTPLVSPTPAPSPTPEGLFVGGEAIVSGTGSALRLRSDPGLQSTTLKTVTDGTRLKILEGPRQADDLTWWRLEDPSDGAQGWAAERFLIPAAAP